ncbi:hypothetical protein CDAR_582171 [Caerostris darwini]|uniref:Uncharacterized protein n=1 Tax=Caerostris darwini TaxID=1538125 RepID=A0AAV4MJV3_9ARAC|nr:hypothetical protein CDAR_582171 [Caerostris darwini]
MHKWQIPGKKFDAEEDIFSTADHSEFFSSKHDFSNSIRPPTLIKGVQPPRALLPPKIRNFFKPPTLIKGVQPPHALLPQKSATSLGHLLS